MVADGGVVVAVTGAEVRTGDGRLAATIDAVDVGGGTQLVTVDGTPEVRTHPSSRVWHARLLAPSRLLPDQLCETDSYDAAVEVGVAYARKLAEHADRAGALADDLRV
jgi:hypothetical protein